jgi:hypothetical protein
MLERSYDTAFINKVVNDPAVRPYVGSGVDGDIDTQILVDNPDNWFLMGEHGGFLFAGTAPGVREVHTFVLPSGRGEWAAAARAKAIEYLRGHGTEKLWTKIEPDSKHVIQYALEGGMQKTDEMVESFGTLYQIYRMELR